MAGPADGPRHARIFGDDLPVVRGGRPLGLHGGGRQLPADADARRHCRAAIHVRRRLHHQRHRNGLHLEHHDGRDVRQRRRSGRVDRQHGVPHGLGRRWLRYVLFRQLYHQPVGGPAARRLDHHQRGATCRPRLGFLPRYLRTGKHRQCLPLRQQPRLADRERDRRQRQRHDYRQPGEQHAGRRRRQRHAPRPGRQRPLHRSRRQRHDRRRRRHRLLLLPERRLRRLHRDLQRPDPDFFDREPADGPR